MKANDHAGTLINYGPHKAISLLIVFAIDYAFETTPSVDHLYWQHLYLANILYAFMTLKVASHVVCELAINLIMPDYPQ